MTLKVKVWRFHPELDIQRVAEACMKQGLAFVTLRNLILLTGTAGLNAALRVLRGGGGGFLG